MATEKPKVDPGLTLNAKALTEVAVAASQAQEDARAGAAETRHDSAHDQVPQLPPEKRVQVGGRCSPLLTLKTNNTVPVHGQDDTIATSPTLAKHVITVTEGTTSTLPAYHPGSPTKDGVPISPHAEKLPSFRQLTAGGQLGPLNSLAEAATQQQQDQRTQTYHHHSASFGSNTSQSPALPYHSYQNSNIHASPSSYHPYSATSPTNDAHYGSPTRFNSAYFAERRTSGSTDHPTPLPPSLHSTSSGESHGNTSSGTDGGYSTSHTTPIESAQPQDSTARSILPPPRGMPQSAVILSSGFTCDYPGCSAAPFQTQYLLR